MPRGFLTSSKSLEKGAPNSSLQCRSTILSTAVVKLYCSVPQPPFLCLIFAETHQADDSTATLPEIIMLKHRIHPMGWSLEVSEKIYVIQAYHWHVFSFSLYSKLPFSISTTLFGSGNFSLRGGPFLRPLHNSTSKINIRKRQSPAALVLQYF